MQRKADGSHAYNSQKEYVSRRKPRVIRCPKNKAEAEFFCTAQQKGISPIKRGWPDFQFYTKTKRFVCVEVKPNDDHVLRYDQNSVMFALAKHGVSCYVWTPTSIRYITKEGLVIASTLERLLF